MNHSATAISVLPDSHAAGIDLAEALQVQLGDTKPDALIVFASSRHDCPLLLQTLADRCGTRTIVGSSSAGEFTHASRGEGYASALALCSDSMKFRVSLGREVGRDPVAAARMVVAGFTDPAEPSLPYRSALIMADALAGHTELLVEEMAVATGGNYRFVGGGAGDDARFQKTFVFAGTEAVSDAVAALEILSDRPVGIGGSHGWEPAGPGYRVTEADGMRLIGLNGAPAVEMLQDHATRTGQQLDLDDPMPFFLHNILGIKSNDSYRLRVPLGISDDGTLHCAAAVPLGSMVHVMRTSAESAVKAAEQATRSALEALDGRPAGAAIVLDCVATRLRLGAAFDDELTACARLLEPAGFVGCNTYGQIARAEGQFSGFHNCTAVVCVLPQ